ncbi:MAG: GDYXXLXY domain-containing protein [Leptolyngbyaceae bacterium]|nr:GDYXXLXY domain-containing protein [Leptolyngbyaceae bacterium]
MTDDSLSPSPSIPTFPTVKPAPRPARLPPWRFWVPLVGQIGLILAVPAQPMWTLVTGKTVVLQTVPVDPYDPMRGYSQTMSYTISRPENLKKLPGWKDVVASPTRDQSSLLPVGKSVYVVLQAPSLPTAEPPQAWQPIRVSHNLPNSLPANQVAIKGKATDRLIEYGLETYYMPEDRRDEINQDISQAQSGQQPQSVVAEVKVSAQGHAVPVSFWVSDRHYHF